MNATQLLKQQHAEVRQLFKKYREAEDPKTKRDAFIELADAFSAHAMVEEKIFYPAVYVGEMTELLEEAVEEHLGAKRIIADLLELEPDEPSFDPKMRVLEEQIGHHVDEEEQELFPKVTQTFTHAELDTLGAEMKEMFTELQRGSPHKQVPKQVDQAPPLV